MTVGMRHAQVHGLEKGRIGIHASRCGIGELVGEDIKMFTAPQLESMIERIV